MQQPLVSVLIITYQHSAFIEKCLSAVVGQSTSFPFEILIGEDESTDGTREICERFASQHSYKVRLFLHSREDVMHIMGRPTGRANFIHLLHEVKGKYIAYCEGDDHWIDPNKLQRQVDALEADPTAMACFTDAYNEREGKRERYYNGIYAIEPKELVGEKDIVAGQSIPTCTMVFRSTALEGVLEYLKEAPVGDIILFTYSSTKGHFIYQPQCTAVRVMHAGGLHSLRSRAHKARMHLRMLPFVDRISGGRYTDMLGKRRITVLRNSWAEAMETNNTELARFVWPQSARHRREIGWNLTTTVRNFFKAYWPWPDKVYSRFFDRAR